MACQGIVDAGEDSVVELADFYRASRGLGSAGTDRDHNVGLDGASERLAGDAQAYQEILKHSVVGVQVGKTHIKTGGEAS